MTPRQADVVAALASVSGVHGIYAIEADTIRLDFAIEIDASLRTLAATRDALLRALTPQEFARVEITTSVMRFGLRRFVHRLK